MRKTVKGRLINDARIVRGRAGDFLAFRLVDLECTYSDVSLAEKLKEGVYVKVSGRGYANEYLGRVEQKLWVDYVKIEKAPARETVKEKPQKNEGTYVFPYNH